MLRINHYTQYTSAPVERLLFCRVQPDDPPGDRHGWTLTALPKSGVLTFRWDARALWFAQVRSLKPRPVSEALAVELVLRRWDVGDGVWTCQTRVAYYDSPADPVRWPSHRPLSHTADDTPRCDLDSMLAIVKQVAAHRCDPLVLLGWVEDHMPEPWSLLASPTPVDAFRALCPLPLFGVSDRVAQSSPG
jgi:hypothetical protein